MAAIAGGALKKTVLELGGSDAYVVLEDADPAAAAKVCVAGRMVNGGQSCIAAKRFVVVEAVRGAFETAVVKEMAAYAPSDPTSAETRFGPLVLLRSRDEEAGTRCAAARRRARACCWGRDAEQTRRPGIRPMLVPA